MIERRASDASVLGVSMEARMARIEGMMETLIREGSGIGTTPRGSIEREDTVSEGFTADVHFGASMESSGMNATPGRQHHQPLPQVQQPQQQQPAYQPLEIVAQHCIPTPSPPASLGMTISVQVGSRSLVFPDANDYSKYIDFFFADVNHSHSCINEAEFRIYSEKINPSRPIQPNDVCFLALNYIIFAVVDILIDTASVRQTNRPPGWQWFQIAEDLIGKRKLSGRGDLRLLQTEVWEAIYLEAADQSNAAYNAIGLASRLCFQIGLHQQSRWGNCSSFETHMRQRLLWTVYTLDKRLSLSCGRPYIIRDSDVDVEQPLSLYDKDLHPDHPIPEQDFSRSAIVNLTCMISWARLAGDVWDQLFSASATKHGLDPEKATILNARISHFIAVTLPSIPLLPTDTTPQVRHLRQNVLIHNRFSHLQLLLYRQTMISLQYDESIGHVCAHLALDTIRRIKPHAPETKISSSFRSHIAVSLGHAILTLSTLLLRARLPSSHQIRFNTYAESFHEACNMLRDMSEAHLMARRVYSDLAETIAIATRVLNHQDLSIPTNIIELFPYQMLDSEQRSNASVEEERQDEASLLADGWEAEFGHPRQDYGILWL